MQSGPLSMYDQMLKNLFKRDSSLSLRKVRIAISFKKCCSKILAKDSLLAIIDLYVRTTLSSTKEISKHYPIY